jgi:hypothetical protein
MDEQDVKIAILSTKLEGIDERQKSMGEHQKLNAQNTDTKFERVFDYLKPMSEWVSQNKDLPNQVKTLWDFHQQNKGFLSATRLITGACGGAVVALIELWGGFKK